MKFNFSKLSKNAVIISVSSLLIASCGNHNNNKESDDMPPIDSTQSTILNINGEIFSIPSPIQTAILIKSSGASYSKDVLNAPNKVGSYSTGFAKALNLGIYGADMGYVTMYDQTQDALGYMNAARKLGDELNVSGAFDNKTIERFSKNLGNRDSLLSLVGNAYRASDAYLKNNDLNDVSALVLAGGWIESLYFATSVYNTKPNEEVKRRIGEQKSSLQSLVKLLNQYYNKPEYTELIDNLKDLSSVYDGVEFIYVYEKPVTDIDKKMTIINSKSELRISSEQLKSISEKIKSIRNQIIG